MKKGELVIHKSAMEEFFATEEIFCLKAIEMSLLLNDPQITRLNWPIRLNRLKSIYETFSDNLLKSLKNDGKNFFFQLNESLLSDEWAMRLIYITDLTLNLNHILECIRSSSLSADTQKELVDLMIYAMRRPTALGMMMEKLKTYPASLEEQDNYSSANRKITRVCLKINDLIKEHDEHLSSKTGAIIAALGSSLIDETDLSFHDEQKINVSIREALHGSKNLTNEIANMNDEDMRKLVSVLSKEMDQYTKTPYEGAVEEKVDKVETLSTTITIPVISHLNLLRNTLNNLKTNIAYESSVDENSLLLNERREASKNLVVAYLEDLFKQLETFCSSEDTAKRENTDLIIRRFTSYLSLLAHKSTPVTEKELIQTINECNSELFSILNKGNAWIDGFVTLLVETVGTALGFSSGGMIAGMAHHQEVDLATATKGIHDSLFEPSIETVGAIFGGGLSAWALFLGKRKIDKILSLRTARKDIRDEVKAVYDLTIKLDNKSVTQQRR